MRSHIPPGSWNVQGGRNTATIDEGPTSFGSASVYYGHVVVSYPITFTTVSTALMNSLDTTSGIYTSNVEAISNSNIGAYLCGGPSSKSGATVYAYWIAFGK